MFSPKYASRKYVDLIRQSSSKWANWDPPIPIEVGSYGTIDSQTGELAVEGNIYDERFRGVFQQHCPGFDLDKFKPVQADPENDFTVSSLGVKRFEFKIEASADVLNLASASIKAEWRFPEGKRGALLVMHAPRQTYIPRNTILEPLHKIPELKDKYLVTSVFSCPAYSLYLSNKSGEKLALALKGSLPIPHAPAVSVGPGGGFDWYASMETSLLRKAAHPEGHYVYVPLYTLQRRHPIYTRLLRDVAPIPPKGDDFWIDVPQPWEPLDEDGEEDPVWDGDEDAEEA